MSSIAESSSTDAVTARRAVFAWLWAVAVVLHLLYLSGSYAAFSSFTFEHVLYLLLGAAAVVLLVVPRSVAALTVVCVLTPVSAWLEAPALGNHWLLASLVSIALLVAITIGSARRSRVSGEAANSVDIAIDRDGFPAVRLVLLVAYGFAALSKFNSSFADPTVSCANVFVDQVSRSIGIGGLHATSGDGWTHVVPFVVMAIEASVVVLLCIARVRVVGVLLAIAFHGIISLDTEHAFSDFTSTIAALVILFLPAEWFIAFGRFVSSTRARLAVRIAMGAVAACSFALLVWQSADSDHGSWRAIGHGRDALWWVIGACLLASVIIAIAHFRTVRSDVALLPQDRWVLVLPGVAALIGLGPWLGVRNATSWNMYANLVTSRGGTNAWFSPGTLQLVPEPDDLVRITASSDAALEQYITSGELVPFVNLRLYTSSHQSFSVTYVRDGETTTVGDTRADTSLGRAPEWWWRKVLTYRSVDVDGPARCQDTMWSLR